MAGAGCALHRQAAQLRGIQHVRHGNLLEVRLP
jgi:hypothetical protein